MTDVDGQTFKNILSCWATGITVITVSSNDDWQAFTANSFASVSMNPPMICMNVANRIDSCDYIAREGHFAINILTENQLDLGKRFAGYLDDQLDNRFDGLECDITEYGDPLLSESMAWLSCTVEHMINLGENTMFIGRVKDGSGTDGNSPLLYHNRQWGKFLTTENK
jgi:flavin reductase (DIM6/NTAB) family NADH-FMN oxidoreductase RutF